jgi:hypothetical protein
VIDGLEAVGVGRAARVELFDQDLRQKIRELTADGSPARVTATVIALWWNDRAAVGAARQILADSKASAADRARILRAMSERKDPADVESIAALAGDNAVPIRIRQQAIDVLATSGDVNAARTLTDRYASMHPELKPAVLNALVRAKGSAAVLLDAVEAKKVPQSEMNANHVRQIQSLGDATNVPLSERFTAGGENSHRAFRLDRLGDLCREEDQTVEIPGCRKTLFQRRNKETGEFEGSILPVGGSGLLLFNAEYRFPIFGPVGGAVFGDIGNVFASPKIDLSDLRYGAGLGVRYLSPVGPVRVDVGFPLDRRWYEDGVVYFISLGYAF